MGKEVQGIDFVFNKECMLENAHRDVGLSSTWSVSHIELKKKLCGSFDECSPSFHECLFSKMGFKIPFNYSEVGF